MNDYKFGNFLCMLREQKGMTQAELAQQLSVTPAAVSKWENGESKPRIETLFTLADILGVSAQELMAGEFIPTEADEEERKKRRKKEFAEHIDMFMTHGVRWRTKRADFIDWLLALLPGYIFFFVILIRAIFALKNMPAEEFVQLIFGYAILGPAIWLLVFALYVLRDVMGNGRSFAYKKQGLVVIDRKTGEQATNRQLIRRNFYFLFLPFDYFNFMKKGNSYRERAADTCVVFQQQLDDFLAGDFAPADAPVLYGNTDADEKKVKRRIVFNAVRVACLVCVFIGMLVIMGSLRQDLKPTPGMYDQKQEAIAYLADSEAFRLLGADKSEIQLVRSSIKQDDATVILTVCEQQFTVICHKENDKWIACADCTDFE